MLGDQTELDVISFDAMARGHRASTSLATNRRIKRTICPVPGCGSSILQRALARHMKTVHKQGPAFVCDAWGRPFPRKDTLDRHSKERHGGLDSKVECIRCGKSVGSRTFTAHFNSRECRNRKIQNQAILSNHNGHPLSEFSRMFSTIMQQSQGYVQLLQGLGIESVCDPLII